MLFRMFGEAESELKKVMKIRLLKKFQKNEKNFKKDLQFDKQSDIISKVMLCDEVEGGFKTV